MSGSDTEYPWHFVDRLEIVWGVGFLSPGGADEVKEITKDVEVSGKEVLDIGCGTGGPDIVLANELNAGRIVGIDVEPSLLERARRNARSAGSTSGSSNLEHSPSLIISSIWLSARMRWSTSATSPGCFARYFVSFDREVRLSPATG